MDRPRLPLNQGANRLAFQGASHVTLRTYEKLLARRLSSRLFRGPTSSRCSSGFRTGFAAARVALPFADRFLVAELFFFGDADADFAFRVVRFLAAPIAAPVSAPIAVPTTGAPTAVPATAPATAPPNVLPAVLVPVSAAPLSSSSMLTGTMKAGPERTIPDRPGARLYGLPRAG